MKFEKPANFEETHVFPNMLLDRGILKQVPNFCKKFGNEIRNMK